jgi:hypothetical protein
MTRKNEICNDIVTILFTIFKLFSVIYGE